MSCQIRSNSRLNSGSARSSLPRRLWGAEPADIRRGARAEMALFEGDPFADAAHLRRPAGVVAVAAPRTRERGAALTSPAG